MCFNAYRVHDPRGIVTLFDELALVEFARVDDAGRFRRRRAVEELADQPYACEMYHLTRPAG